MRQPLPFFGRLTEAFLPKKTAAIPLKRSLTGYEAEMFVLKADGSIDGSDTLFPLAKAKKLAVQKECAKAMIEVDCLPSRSLRTSSQSLVDNLIALSDLAERKDKHLFPFSCYFGRNAPDFRRSRSYTIKQKVLGEDYFVHAGKCCGFHQHYTLPRGIFDHRKKFIRYMKNSKINKAFIDSYNLVTAMDPVIIALSQSSPYVDGKPFAKDSRVILYRGGRMLGYPKGVYGKQKLFGALSPYKSTVHDLLSLLRRREQKWKMLMQKQGIPVGAHGPLPSTLDYTWNPVKVNAKNTLEYRGADMNFLSTLLGISTMVRFALQKVQQDFLIVAPLDMDVGEAFKVENNLLFIPPFSVVNTKLQKRAAYAGLADPMVHMYVKRFFGFIRKISSGKYTPLLRPVQEMIDTRKTQSDRILAYFKRKGYSGNLPDDAVKEASVKFSADFRKDLSYIQQKLSGLIG